MLSQPIEFILKKKNSHEWRCPVWRSLNDSKEFLLSFMDSVRLACEKKGAGTKTAVKTINGESCTKDSQSHLQQLMGNHRARCGILERSTIESQSFKIETHTNYSGSLIEKISGTDCSRQSYCNGTSMTRTFSISKIIGANGTSRAVHARRRIFAVHVERPWAFSAQGALIYAKRSVSFVRGACVGSPDGLRMEFVRNRVIEQEAYCHVNLAQKLVITRRCARMLRRFVESQDTW